MDPKPKRQPVDFFPILVSIPTLGMVNKVVSVNFYIRLVLGLNGN
jgi:hypothetical protein